MEIIDKFVCSKCTLSFMTGQQLGGHLRWSCNLKRKLDVMEEQVNEEGNIQEGFDNLANDIVDLPIPEVNFACVTIKNCMSTTKIRKSKISIFDMFVGTCHHIEVL